MYDLDYLLAILEEFAPLSLSQKMIEKGSYDNSGIIIKSHEKVGKILFSLDLSEGAVEEAVRVGADTIVTHHPAIYTPLKSISFCDASKPVFLAVNKGLNVISMHLNLDIAEYGIDEYLSYGLTGKRGHILSYVDDKNGYGREAKIDKISLEQFVTKISSELGSEKIVCYGQNEVSVVASFCGAGASEAVKIVNAKETDADTIVTSDIAHHEILALVEQNKNVVIIPHYVSENYGFNKFYQSASKKIDFAQTYYFTDKRFM